MKIDDIIVLTKAGFSKDEIFALIGSSSTASPAPEKKAAELQKPAATAPEKQETVEDTKDEHQDIASIIDKKFNEAFKPFEDLYNNIAIKANMPTIGNVEPRGIEDIIDDFFTK